MRTLVARLAVAGALVALPSAFGSTPASANCSSTAEYMDTGGACYNPADCPEFPTPTAECDDGWRTPPDDAPGFGEDIRDCAVYAYLEWGGYNLWGIQAPLVPPPVCHLLVPPAPTP